MINLLNELTFYLTRWLLCWHKTCHVGLNEFALLANLLFEVAAELYQESNKLLFSFFLFLFDKLQSKNQLSFTFLWFCSWCTPNFTHKKLWMISTSLFYLKIRSRNQISFFLVPIYSFCCVLCVTQACAFMKFMFCTIYPKDVHLVKFPIVKCLESLSSIYENLYKHTHLSCMSHLFHLTVGITTGKSYWLPTSPCEISPIFKKVPHYFKNWAYTFQN